MLTHGIFLTILAFSLGLLLVVFSIPVIIRVAEEKRIFDLNDYRKKHAREVPAIGGVAIFIGFTLSTILSTNGYNIDSLKYIFAAIIILFFTGLKDDILVISPNKKFIIQLLAALMLIILGNVRITNLQLVFRLQEISYPGSLFISLLLIIATVNAYNFIDGIDGLASGLGILSSTVFGTWFLMAGDITYAVMSYAMAGSLTGFFYFNVFGKKNKLFMGDAGSLVIGLVSAALVIRFVEMNLDKSTPHAVYGSPAVAFAILLIPLFDLVRVFIVRLSQKRSPFFADNNHIHHRLLKLVRSHLSISLIMMAVNLGIILFSFYLSFLEIPVNIHLIILLSLGIFFSAIPIGLLYYRNKQAKASG